MSAVHSVVATVGYTITEKGRQDLREAETCACKPKLAGLLFECPVCGTVWGHIRDMSGWGNGRAEFKR